MAEEKKMELGAGQKVKDPNRTPEKEKPKSKEPIGIPKQERIRCTVYNVERPGADIQACFCGTTFVVKHGAVVDLTPAQIEILNHAVIETTEYVETVPGERWETRPLVKPRFMVQVMGIARTPKLDFDQQGATQ